MTICLTKREFVEELKPGIGCKNFELICDAYYAQFLNQPIVSAVNRMITRETLKAAESIYACSAQLGVLLDLLATKINRMIDRKMVKAAGDIASLELQVNMSKAAIVYIAENLEVEKNG